MLDILKKFFRFCSDENRKKFYISIVLGVIAALFSALKIPAIAVLLQAILNGNITNGAIFGSLGIMLLSIIGTSVVKYKATMLQTEAGYGTAANKRIEIAEHMRYLPMGYFNENSLGYITSVTTNTMENLSDVGTRVVMMVTEGVFSTLVITLMILCFDWRVGLLVIAGIVLYFLANALMQNVSRSKTPEKTRSDAAVVEKVLEYIKGIAEVKSYHLSGKYNKRLETAIDENVAANTNMEIGLIPYMSLQNAVAKLTGVAIAILSLLLYTSGNMSLLYCVMMVVCSFMVTEGLEKAGTNSALIRIVDNCVDKANDILNLPAMDISGDEITPSSYEIKADNIDFSYDKKKIIDGVSLTVPERTTTAIVGPSGGGKTTLCHLISRFWDVDSGTVTLGGTDIRKYSMDSLMKNFSFVFQNVYLFKDTVANNIRFGQPDAPMENVIAAAKKARCHDFIMNLPKGYETVIGESGGTLSGGERQRLSIARAIMKDSPIIILDEATANVDPENEKELMEAIDELTKEKTIIMIAHRLKTVQGANQILVVDNGRIVQCGTHKELMNEKGIYRNFISGREQAVGWKL
ncbi:MAG: ABC transporter ATP-binding protein [Acutalibacteraceae bacterium]